MTPATRRATRRGPRPGGGFTLIELLISVALTVLIVGIVAQVFSLTTTISGTSLEHINASRELQGTLDQLERDLTRLERTADSAFAMFVTPGAGLYLNQPVEADQIAFTCREGANDDLVFVNYRLEATSNAARPRLIRAVTRVQPIAGALTLVGAEDRQPMIDGAIAMRIRILDRQASINNSAAVLREPSLPTEDTALAVNNTTAIDNQVVGVGLPPPFLVPNGAGLMTLTTGSRPVVIVDRPAATQTDVLVEGLPSGFNSLDNGNVSLVAYAEPAAIEVGIRVELRSPAKGTLTSARLVGAR